MTDEHTMMSQQQLHHVDLRLKEIMVDERKFGGCVVVMFDNLAQLPPEIAISVCVSARTGNDLAGWNLHTYFAIVTKLIEKKD